MSALAPARPNMWLANAKFLPPCTLQTWEHGGLAGAAENRASPRAQVSAHPSTRPFTTMNGNACPALVECSSLNGVLVMEAVERSSIGRRLARRQTSVRTILRSAPNQVVN